jgi:DNA-nicking Smr family endonuclease
MTRGTEDEEEGAEESLSEVILPIEDWIDLHTFRPGEIRSVVEAYLEAAVEAGLEEVRLIHGRGIGSQRRSVRALLSRHPDVLRFADAPADRGGWGATIAWLRIGKGSDRDPRSA